VGGSLSIGTDDPTPVDCSLCRGVRWRAAAPQTSEVGGLGFHRRDKLESLIRAGAAHSRKGPANAGHFVVELVLNAQFAAILLAVRKDLGKCHNGKGDSGGRRRTIERRRGAGTNGCMARQTIVAEILEDPEDGPRVSRAFRQPDRSLFAGDHNLIRINDAVRKIRRGDAGPLGRSEIAPNETADLILQILMALPEEAKVDRRRDWPSARDRLADAATGRDLTAAQGAARKAAPVRVAVSGRSAAPRQQTLRPLR
jgi:hypothetical protein